MRRTVIFMALLLLGAGAVDHRVPVSGQPGPAATLTPVRTPGPPRSRPVCRQENGSPVLGEFASTGEVLCPAPLFTAPHVARPQELYSAGPLPGRLTLLPYAAVGLTGPERSPPDSPRPAPRQSVSILSYSDQPIEIDANQLEATLVAPAGHELRASSSGGVTEPCWQVDRRSNVVRCRTSAGRNPVFIQITTVPLQPTPTDQLSLPAGCSRVQLTWPEWTPLFAVGLAHEPSAAVVSIWRFFSREDRFIAYAPDALTRAFGFEGTTNDFAYVGQPGEEAIICLREPARLTQPRR